VLAPLHRILVDPGAELSLIGKIRTSVNANLSLQLSWYPDTRGPSTAQTIEPIAVQCENVWEPFRFDVAVPPNIVAIGFFLRLEPPLLRRDFVEPFDYAQDRLSRDAQSRRSAQVTGLATADFDNIRIIEWSPAGSAFSPLYEHILVVGAGEATLSKYLLPGSDIGAVSPELLPVE